MSYCNKASVPLKCDVQCSRPRCSDPKMPHTVGRIGPIRHVDYHHRQFTVRHACFVAKLFRSPGHVYLYVPPPPSQSRPLPTIPRPKRSPESCPSDLGFQIRTSGSFWLDTCLDKYASKALSPSVTITPTGRYSDGSVKD